MLRLLSGYRYRTPARGPVEFAMARTEHTKFSSTSTTTSSTCPMLDTWTMSACIVLLSIVDIVVPWYVSTTISVVVERN